MSLARVPSRLPDSATRLEWMGDGRTCSLPRYCAPSTALVTSRRGSRRQRVGDSGLASVFERRRDGRALLGDEAGEPAQPDANGLKRLGSGGGGGEDEAMQRSASEMRRGDGRER